MWENFCSEKQLEDHLFRRAFDLMWKSRDLCKHPCHLCKKTFAQKSNLKTHLFRHANSQEFWLDVKIMWSLHTSMSFVGEIICSKATWKLIFSDMLTFWNFDWMWKSCDLCTHPCRLWEKTFAQKSNLKTHLIRFIFLTGLKLFTN